MEALDRAMKLLRLCSSPEPGERAVAALRLYEHVERHDLAFTSTTHHEPRSHARPSSKQTAKPDPPRRMSAKFDGYCKGCHHPVSAGDEILWSPKDGEHPGTYHPKCYPGASF